MTWTNSKNKALTERAQAVIRAPMDGMVTIGDVKVGDGTWIGPWVLLDGTGGLSIGANIDSRRMTGEAAQI